MEAPTANGSAKHVGPSSMHAYREALKSEFAYLEGQVPLTICRGKAPTPMGDNWQTQRLDYDAAERLIDSTEFVAMGAMLGPEGGVDFDIDGADELEAFVDLFDGEPPVLPAYTSGRAGGEHRLAAFDNRLLAIGKATVKYKTADGKSVTVRIGCKVQKDGTIGGAQSIIPPSYHTELDENDRPRWTGRQYAWKPNLSLEEIGLPQLPDSVIAKLLAAAGPQKPQDDGAHADDAAAEYGPGNRHDRLCSLAGSLRARGCGFDTILAGIRAENETKCKPPKPDTELLDIARYYAEAEAGASPPPKPRRKISYQRLSSRELGTGDFTLEYYITDTMVGGQPLVVSGGYKTLKTSLLVDAVISLATAKPFLGLLEVPQARRVGFMSGESGLPTIQETARRVCISKGLHLEDCDNVVWTPDIPRFGQQEHTEALREFMQNDELEVLAIDPAYLAMPSADAGNLMAQGELLRSIGELCQSMGVSLIIAHHNKRNTGRDASEPPELSDISWAGWAEFARQWWLLGRREPYMPGSGEHRLWLSVGGSAGHSALWGVNVNEGVRTENSDRVWDVTLVNARDVQSQSTDRRDQIKQERAAAKAAREIEGDRSAVVKAMRKLKQRETAKEIAIAARLSGARGKAALLDLIETGEVVRGEPLKKGNGQSYDTYELKNEDE